MPFYEYRCDKGHVTEKLRPIADRELPVFCEAGCKGLNIAKRILSPTPTTFVCAGGRKL